MSHTPGSSKRSKGKTPSPSPGAADPLENLGELPRGYNTETVFLVAREPNWLFTYWDLDITRHPGGKTFLRILKGGTEIEQEIEVSFETRNWYVPVATAGASYAVEIGFYRGLVWNVLGRSPEVTTPTDTLSEDEVFEYATIPLHLSFQRMVDSIRPALTRGEAPVEVLARLQHEARLATSSGGGSEQLNDATNRRALELLLGEDMLARLFSGSLSSEELSSHLAARFGENLSSEAFSSALGGTGFLLPLFSGLSSMESAASSSWAAGASLSSWVAAALTSWAAAVQSSFTLTTASSWSGAAGALSSWSSGAESSWISASGASWSGAAFSSWFESASTSWAGAALSSWSAAALSSWTHAAVTSWSHAETSSWGHSETMPAGRSRDFFLHVNAEVIFYGGTHPAASVTIDGKPVKLNPDGSFRHHFIFPDGTYEIPIHATSPDGVETRSAFLRFDRATGRVGIVGATAQPPLPSPMGTRP